jgi:glycosyltransferase involved in cell wall biosynthesis
MSGRAVPSFTGRRHSQNHRSRAGAGTRERNATVNAHKVVMVLENDRYPADSRVLKEAESLTSAGFAVEVLAPRERGFPTREVIRGVKVTRFRLHEGYGALGRTAIEYLTAACSISVLVLRRIVSARSGTLHVHNPPDIFFPLLWLARLRGWSTVFDHHDDAEGMLRDKLGRASWLEKVMVWLRDGSARAADLTIATNETQRSLVASQARRTVVVLNAPPDSFADHSPSPPNGRAQLVFLGEMGTQDRVDRAVDVLAHIVREHGVDAALLIVGDGPERGHVEERADEQQLRDRVTITGFIPYGRVPGLLATAHVGLDTAALTEANHGTSMVKIFEYLAVGLPVVASALRETRITGEDAVIAIDSDQAEAFVAPLVRLLTDTAAWEAAAERSRRRGEQLRWPAQAELLIDEYQRLCRLR